MTAMSGSAAAPTSHLIPTDAGATVLPALCQSIMTAHSVTTSAALTLFQQIPFQNGLLPTLPEDQALAANHAQTFITGWGSGVANGLFEGLSSIADDVEGLLSDPMLPLAKKLDTTDPKNPGYADLLTDFGTALSALQDAATSLDPDSGSTLLSMQTLCTDVQSLASLVGDDATRLAAAVNEVDSEQPIKALTDKQQTLQNQLADVNTTIASGATDQILPSIMFGIKLGASLVNPLETGINKGTVAGGILSIVGEGQAIAAYNQQIQAEYDKQTTLIQQISDLAKEIAADKTDMMTLSLTAAQIALFNVQISNLVKSAQSLITEMNGWNIEIGELGLVSSPPTDGYFTAQVNDAQAFWSDLNAALNRYLAIIAASGSSEVAQV